ncbi:MAG: hypothetical protein U0U69_05725 [Acidimicrobiia bacterium]
MAYSALVRQILIAAPSDVAKEDLDTIERTMLWWNGTYGESLSAVASPLHWTINAAAEHGVRPQSSINRQLVDRADGLIAVFWHRLGSATGTDDSGTAEEIRHAAEAGKYVAVLRCERAYPANDVSSEQLAALDQFFESVRNDSLYVTYATPAELGRHVQAILMQLITRDKESTQNALGAELTILPAAEVSARVDREESTRTDSKGRVHRNKNWYIVLTNNGKDTARDVSFELQLEDDDDKELPRVIGEDRPIEYLVPDNDMRYPVAVFMGVADQVRCIIRWTDDRGPREELSTLRFF